MANKSIFINSGFLWDGNKHLSGKLELTADVLIFHFDTFKESNLNLEIPLKEIQEVKVFKLFELANKGLIVLDKGGRTNMFVIENPGKIKKEIINCLNLY